MFLLKNQDISEESLRKDDEDGVNKQAKNQASELLSFLLRGDGGVSDRPKDLGEFYQFWSKSIALINDRFNMIFNLYYCYSL